MCKDDKEEKDMLAHVDERPMNNVLRRPKNKRTNLLSSATDETFKTLNEITKKQRGLSNLTLKKMRREE